MYVLNITVHCHLPLFLYTSLPGGQYCPLDYLDIPATASFQFLLCWLSWDSGTQVSGDHLIALSHTLHLKDALINQFWISETIWMGKFFVLLSGGAWLAIVPHVFRSSISNLYSVWNRVCVLSHISTNHFSSPNGFLASTVTYGTCIYVLRFISKEIFFFVSR